MIPKEEAYKFVGKSFVQFTDDNKAWGCLAPYYLIHPEFKDFFTLEDTKEFLKLAKERFEEIKLEDIKYGFYSYFNAFRVMAYNGLYRRWKIYPLHKRYWCCS
jgi:hypothetical protein